MSGTIWLPQSTAFSFRLGPFLSAIDAKTRMTGLTIPQASRLLSKAGGAFTQQATTGNLTHDGAGYYTMALTTGDTDTLGPLELDVDIATAFVVTRVFQIITAESMNALNGSGNGLRANITAINSISGAASKLAEAVGVNVLGTVDTASFTATTTRFQSTDVATAGNDHYNGRLVAFRSGSLAGQFTRIEDYTVTGGKGDFTVTALNAAPSNGTTFIIL